MFFVFIYSLALINLWTQWSENMSAVLLFLFSVSEGVGIIYAHEHSTYFLPRGERKYYYVYTQKNFEIWKLRSDRKNRSTKKYHYFHINKFIWKCMDISIQLFKKKTSPPYFIFRLIWKLLPLESFCLFKERRDNFIIEWIVNPFYGFLVLWMIVKIWYNFCRYKYKIF